MQEIDIIQLLLFFIPIGLTVVAEIVFKGIFKGIHEQSNLEHRSRFAGILVMILGYLYFISKGSIAFDSFSKSYSWTDDTEYWLIPLIIATVVAAKYINRKLSEKGKQLSLFPKGKQWEYLLVWILYLLIYEFYFRGLLFPYKDVNLTLAIGINLFFYVLAHVHHGKEAIAAIPYGIIICLVTAKTGNLWSAYISHLLLAFTVQFVGRGYFKLKTKKVINQRSNH